MTAIGNRQTSAVALPDRYRGALLGLAVGDALGTTLEFTTPGSFEPISDMIGGGPFDLEPGRWTDDTSLALCLAESLIQRQGFDATDQMQRYLNWWRWGYLSSTGECFDIGDTTMTALARFEADGEPFAGSTDPLSAGNGSLMRLAPIPLWFADDPVAAIRWAAESSRTTHGAREAVDACRYFAGLLVGALRGETRERLLAPMYTPVAGLWEREPLAPRIADVAGGSFQVKAPPDIQGSGYVVRSLEAALWAFARADSFADGALAAVNLGDDADTTGAVYGQIAGAFWGVDALPEAWLQRVAMRERIESMADALRGTRV